MLQFLAGCIFFLYFFKHELMNKNFTKLQNIPNFVAQNCYC